MLQTAGGRSAALKVSHSLSLAKVQQPQLALLADAQPQAPDSPSPQGGTPPLVHLRLAPTSRALYFALRNVVVSRQVWALKRMMRSLRMQP